MSLFIYKIQFSEGIPSFYTIQKRFLEQTGLDIHLLAQLQVPVFHTSSSVIFNALALDTAKVADLELQYMALKEQQKKERDTAENWDDFNELKEYKADPEISKKLDDLSRICEVRLSIPGFYEIYFTIEGTTLKIETSSFEVYAMNSLFKVFYDLGGRWEGATNDVYPHYWKKLKKWNEYRWYNRPQK